MASATVDTPSLPAAAAVAETPLQLDSIPTVDLRLLSQSELYSLSQCSPSAFDPRRLDDVVSPKLDRSVFNESAGSRKQTYSRLRLAPAASSTALRSRTPHLRATNHNPNQPSMETDPESFQIVSLLKQLFKAEANPSDLIPIPVDYSVSVSQLPNAAPAGFKRKRGRPRKDKSDIVNSNFSHASHSNGDLAMTNVVVYDNSVDRDKEIVNADGVPVDMVALGSLEDPFSMELRRRTEGLEGEEKLLGFLEGLNGQWGSRRKKRRIVDASQFGTTLPKGWKLLLSLKRKAGRVWVYCRRYISPNGRHFVSCKEVSIYLLSLRSEQGTVPFNSIESSKSILDGDKHASTDTNKMLQIRDTVVPDVTKKENVASHVSSPPVSNTSVNDQMQDVLKLGDLQEVHVGEIAHCENCNLDFGNKDDLLQHQSSCQRRKRSKSGQSISDGVIIKDGKFVCQFCHKSFDERHRYNGHVGTHVRNQVKSAIESLQVNMGSQTDSTLQEPIVANRDFSEISGLDTKTKMNSSPKGNFGNLDGEHLETFDKSISADAPVDLFSNKSTRCSTSETILSNDENTACCPPAAEDASEKANNSYDQQGRNSSSSSPFPLNDKLDIVKNSATGGTSSIVEFEKGPISGSDLHSSDGNVETCDVDELQLDKDRHAANKESISGLCINSSGLDGNTQISVQLPCDAESCREEMNGVSVSSIPTGSAQKRVSEDCLKTLSGDAEERAGNLNLVFSSCVDEQRFDDMSSDKKNYSGGCAESNNDNVSNLEMEDHFGCAPSWKKDIDSAEKYGSQFPDCFEEEPREQKTLESGLLSLSGYEKNDAIENYVDNVSMRKVDNLDVNILQDVNVDDELIFPFSSSHGALNADASTDLKQDRSLNFSLFSDGNENKACKSNVEMYEQEPSETAMLPPAFVQEASNQAFSRARSYTNSLDGPKLNGLHGSVHQDLNLSFGNSHVEVGANANTMQLQQQGYPAGRSGFQFGVGQTYGAQTSLHNIDHRRVENQKQGGVIGVDLQNSSFNSNVVDFGNNYNTVFSNTGWGEQRMDEVGKFGKNIMTSARSNNIVQPNKGMMDDNIWRTSVGNLLNHDGSAANANSLVQSSNCFQTYDIMSDKGEGLFKLNQNIQKYDRSGNFEGLRPERSEPVEYSFMGTQSLSCGQQDSKVFSYGVDMGEGFNSPFWLGKDTGVAPNLSGRNMVPTVCIWCSSAFYQDAIQSGAHAAAGSMCPTCSSRI
ncbi:PREDICTED: uncharacterized protein LOC109170500 isoform X3 [Ipomoea nil]|uniref:uncharacterized protein LOC109170500 isoform X2 n=1 Tax=Ipomoea nil TaxID=35883 RepID=UPI000901420A|nr:PREDICTED: uncharacterized protein LOC109170500 isoform X2 [Ipomoea nil]XP_019175185.1 PREDICTED: uncharacterized protein LOC109170500 isoform X3 [Ipomoea nil]